MSEEEKERTSWFVPNSSGVGYHPQTWQGWAILIGVVVVLITVILLIRLT